MRIIAGKFRSRIIEMVPLESTKETSDKVRGAVFNSLGYTVENSKVLDLFAGSGSYGLEAISRGASYAMFNDVKLEAYRIISKNVSLLKVNNVTKILNLDYLKALTYIIENNFKFDIIFLDPPYAMDVYESTITNLNNNLENDGIIVCEMHKDHQLDLTKIKGFKIKQEKIYGIKKINYIIRDL